jgi:hypothetical protein
MEIMNDKINKLESHTTTDLFENVSISNNEIPDKFSITG